MSDPTYPGASVDRARPSTVTVSSYLLYVVAAIQIVSFLINLSALGTFQRVYRDAFAGTDQPAVGETVATVTLVGGSALGLLLGIATAALAMLNNRGRNGSRITTWVLGGIFLCCSGLGLAGSLAGTFTDLGGRGNNANGPDPAEVQRRLDESLPGWYNPITTTLSVISVLALLGALILLALPASNAFFRKPLAGTGPLPGSGYGEPSYPDYPNYPAYPPGEPPLPPAPGPPPPPGAPPPGPPDR